VRSPKAPFVSLPRHFRHENLARNLAGKRESERGGESSADKLTQFALAALSCPKPQQQQQQHVTSNHQSLSAAWVSLVAGCWLMGACCRPASSGGQEADMSGCKQTEMDANRGKHEHEVTNWRPKARPWGRQ